MPVLSRGRVLPLRHRNSLINKISQLRFREARDS